MASASEPTQYLPFLNKRAGVAYTPDTIIKCCVCPTPFRVKDGFAIAASHNGSPIIGLFCTAVCFLQAVPLECCGRGG